MTWRFVVAGVRDADPVTERRRRRGRRHQRHRRPAQDRRAAVVRDQPEPVARTAAPRAAHQAQQALLLRCAPFTRLVLLLVASLPLSESCTARAVFLAFKKTWEKCLSMRFHSGSASWCCRQGGRGEHPVADPHQAALLPPLRRGRAELGHQEEAVRDRLPQGRGRGARGRRGHLLQHELLHAVRHAAQDGDRRRGGAQHHGAQVDRGGERSSPRILLSAFVECTKFRAAV